MEPTEPATTEETTTIDISDVVDLDALLSGVFKAFGGKTEYLESLLCHGDNAAEHDDIATHFGGSCPKKTGNVHKAIIKQVNNFGNKIEKEAKKLFSFNHKFCSIQWQFRKQHVPYWDVDFSSASSMSDGMQAVQAAWQDEIKRQLEEKGGKCTNFIGKNQTSVKKIVKWNSDLVKKVKLNSNNFEKKLFDTLKKEVTKAEKDAAKAAKGK